MQSVECEHLAGPSEASSSAPTLHSLGAEAQRGEACPRSHLWCDPLTLECLLTLKLSSGPPRCSS